MAFSINPTGSSTTVDTSRADNSVDPTAVGAHSNPLVQTMNTGGWKAKSAAPATSAPADQTIVTNPPEAKAPETAPKAEAKTEAKTEPKPADPYRKKDDLARREREVNRKAAEAKRLDSAREMYANGDLKGIAALFGVEGTTEFIAQMNRAAMGQKTEPEETAEQAAERKAKEYAERVDKLEAQVFEEKNERIKSDYIRTNITPVLAGGTDEFPLVLDGVEIAEVEAALFDAVLRRFVDTSSSPEAGDGERLDPKKLLADWEENLEADEAARQERLRASKRLGARLGFKPKELASEVKPEPPAASEKPATEAAKAEGEAMAALAAEPPAELSPGAALRAQRTPQRKLTPPAPAAKRPPNWFNMSRAERLKQAGY